MQRRTLIYGVAIMLALLLVQLAQYAALQAQIDSNHQGAVRARAVVQAMATTLTRVEANQGQSAPNHALLVAIATTEARVATEGGYR